MSHLEATPPTPPLVSHAVLMAVLALTACAGAPATAQAPSPADGAAPRAHMYTVSPEHAAALAPQATRADAFVEVSGTGSVTVLPDRVQASFAVETRAADAAGAAAENALLMDRVIRALRGAGIPGLEVETFGYALNPQYAVTDPPRSRVIDGYAALNNIRVTSNDVSAAGKLVDAAIGAGANRVSGLGFGASDTEAARREALTQAVRSARLQAEAMADALGSPDPLPPEGW